MTHTQYQERVRGVAAGLAIALVTLALLFASASLTRAQTIDATATTAIDNSMGPVLTTGPLGTIYTYSTSTNPISSTGNPTSSSTSANATSSASVGTTSTVVPVIAAPPTSVPMPMVVTVNSDGTTLIRGVVQSVGSDSLAIASWGGTWIIRTGASTQTVASSATNLGSDLSGIQLGDFVGAYGVVAANASWTVNATNIRDWTRVPSTRIEEQSMTGEGSTGSAASAGTTTDNSGTSSSALPTGDSLHTGTATNVSDTGFTLTDTSGATYPVTVTPGATVWDTNRNTIPMANIQENDSVRLDGVLNSDGSISADVVRDTAR